MNHELPNRPEMIILDSGGYEVSTDRDLSDVKEPVPGKKPWDVQKLGVVLDAWPHEIPTILVNYDHPDERIPFLEQVAAARELFRNRKHHLNAFLLKPENAKQYTLREALSTACSENGVAELRSFDVIGLAEKELGSSMIDRMVRVAKLRDALDKAGIGAPIHIFGSLDPLTTCLYFLAGAEIFDGLTWIRYAYRDGMCIYTDNAAALKWDLDINYNLIKGHTLRDNLIALDMLRNRLRVFYDKQDFQKLPHAEVLQKAEELLNVRLKKKGGS